MKTRHALLHLVLFYLFVGFAHSQSYQVPQNFKLEKAEDYAKYVPEVLKCIEYLETTPLDSAQDTRKAANTFLLKWLTGSPSVEIEMQSYVTELAERNNDFLMIYLGGWARHVLQSQSAPENFSCHLAGLRSVLTVYQKGRGVKKDKRVEKLVALAKQEGKLEDWLKQRLKGK